MDMQLSLTSFCIRIRGLMVTDVSCLLRKITQDEMGIFLRFKRYLRSKTSSALLKLVTDGSFFTLMYK